MLSSHDIATKKFERSTLGGYRNDDVDGFLNQAASTIDQLEEQNNVLTKKLEVLADKLEEYRNDEESLRSALLGAQKLGDSVIRESKSKAEIILRDATIKAERTIAHAHDQVEKEKLIYIKLQKDVAAFKNKLLATYKQHLEIISSLPEDPYVDKDFSGEEEIAPAPRKNASQADVGAPPSALAPETPVKESQRPQPEAAYEEKVKPRPQPEPIHEEKPRQRLQPEPIHEERLRQRFQPKLDYEEETAQTEHREEVAQEQQHVRRRAAAPKFSFTPRHLPADLPVAEEDADQELDSAPPADPAVLNLTAEEYYEAFEDEDRPSVPKKPSKFGTLKFGAGYDLKR